MIPGPAGKQGKDGKTTPPVIWFETAPPLEPAMIPGNKGAPGVAGAAGPPSTGTGGHEGVLAFGQTIPEPAFGMGIPGAFGPQGDGFFWQGEWDPASLYFGNDVVRYHGDLYLDFKIPIAPGTLPTDPTSNWVLFLQRGTPGFPGVPTEAAPPREPMMIPGARGPAGAAADPYQGSYAPGSFVVPTGKYVVMSRRLTLTGAQRATLQGTAALRIT